jgi:hypothetical protein
MTSTDAFPNITMLMANASTPIARSKRWVDFHNLTVASANHAMSAIPGR